MVLWRVETVWDNIVWQMLACVRSMVEPGEGFLFFFPKSNLSCKDEYPCYTFYRMLLTGRKASCYCPESCWALATALPPTGRVINQFVEQLVNGSCSMGVERYFERLSI